MRATLFVGLGLLEAALATVLAVFAWQLPGPAEVRDGVGRAERVSRQTGDQVRRLQEQVQGLRERRPQMHELAVRIQGQLRAVTDGLRGQRVDFSTVQTV